MRRFAFGFLALAVVGGGIALAATSFTVTYTCPQVIADADSYTFKPTPGNTVTGRITACAVEVSSGNRKCSDSMVSGMAVSGATTIVSLANTLLAQWQTDNCK